MSVALPKLSYVFLTHNREKYVRAALESAFAQDYEGELEYIISDDCSTDKTFEIVKECVASYKGKRRIVVTQTPYNMHLAGNTNHAVSFVESDWIVRADDDDIASIDRCSLIGRAIAENPGCTYFFSRILNFKDDEEDKVIHLSQVPTLDPNTISVKKLDISSGFHPVSFWNTAECSHQVWSMETFRKFGPLPPDAYYIDDLTCYYRANALGYGIFIDAVTMYIRNGSLNMSRGSDDGSRGYLSIIRLEHFLERYNHVTYRPLQEIYRSLVAYSIKCEAERYEIFQPFLDELNQDLEKRSLMLTYWSGSTWDRLVIRKKLGYNSWFSLLRCLHLPFFALLLSIYRLLLKNNKFDV